MAEKKRMSFNIKKSIVTEIDGISRIELPNKSKLVEELLEKWLEKRKKDLEKKLSNV